MALALQDFIEIVTTWMEQHEFDPEAVELIWAAGRSLARLETATRRPTPAFISRKDRPGGFVAPREENQRL
jgi:hypothetical protein